MEDFSGVLWPIERPRVTLPFKADWTKWYSAEKPHRGVDIAPFPGSTGRPVRSPLHGTVSQVGFHEFAGNELVISGSVPYAWGAEDLEGRYVAFKAGELFYVRMTHHSEILVPQGVKVAAGQHVANIGSTGRYTSGPHVHLEIRKGAYEHGHVVNPLHFFVAAIPGLKPFVMS